MGEAVADRQPVWTLEGEELMRMLRQVADGDTPEMVYAEAYANSEVRKYDEQPGD